MSKKILFSVTFLLALSGCATTGEKTETATETPVTYINQYPTRDRVEYVLQCVAKHGGLTFVTQYACGCKIDKIAEKLTFDEYEAATTFGYMRKTPGENGGAFRDPKQSKSLKKRLKEAEAYAERMCFVK
jgi:ABC-type Fe3+-hydroxamate transport system substrate-binding protein